MIKQIDGACYIELLSNGIKNLEKHRTVLNDLNVFPVPDGDTGTNMVMTLKYAYDAVKNQDASLDEIAGRFAKAAVFGARGNSGVIVSQFFKGVSEGLSNCQYADAKIFAYALSSGCEYAYASVAKPVEGTMLTVIKDASKAAIDALPLQSIEEVIEIFLKEARVSLANTPELLPILKKANVVDSGGSGIVYFFEGINKFFVGEDIVVSGDGEKAEEYVDLSLFNKDTSFEYGYCNEGLIQLKIDVSDFNLDLFKGELSKIGNSVVASLEGDKVKIHVHTKFPGKLMNFCQQYGEFLTIKIENMTVQNTIKQSSEPQNEKFLYSKDRPIGKFAIVAVAPNELMQRKFFEMGADIVILSEIAPSSNDFLEAFKLTGAKRILVFPNSSNSILSSMQAGSLHKKAIVSVLNSRSVAECYSARAVMDFEADIDSVISNANATLSNIYQLSIYQAIKDLKYGSKNIYKNDFFALSANKILAIDTRLDVVTLNVIEKTLENSEVSVVTLFYGDFVSEEYVSDLVERINDLDLDIEVATVSTKETNYDFTIIFE